MPRIRAHRLTRSSRATLAAAALAAAFLSPVEAQNLGNPICTVPPLIQPNGPIDRSNEGFPTCEHLFLHSSTHLQGQPAAVKRGGGLLFGMPTVPSSRSRGLI